MRVVFRLLTAGLLAAAALPAQAQDWCGFIDKEYSQVRCGFSSRNECEQAFGEKKAAYCVLDPDFAANGRGTGVRLAANRF